MDSCIPRIAIFNLALFLLTQAALSQGPAVNTLSAGLSDIASRSGRKTLAVVDFTDLQGCVTELGRYMAEDVSVALVNNAKGFEVIDRTNLRVLMQEHKLVSTGLIDPATARKLGQVIGVDALVTGTIAPLSDSVHVSAKVLDVETAKMLGGIAADIPRTRAVEELLAKGVANCGSSTPAPGNLQGTTGQGGANPVQRQTAAASTATAGDIVISIEGCRQAGDRIRCSGSVMNSGKETQNFKALCNNMGSCCNPSYMTDNLGNRSQLDGDGPAMDATLEPGLPLNINFSGRNLSSEATSVWISLGSSTRESNGRGDRWTSTFRNLPVRPK